MAKGLKRVALYSLVGFAGLILLVFLAAVGVGYQSAHGSVDADRAMMWIMGPFAVAAMIGSMIVAIAWMRSIDEAAREAHKAAWFWGGCGGMAVGGVFVVLASLPQAASLQLPSWFEGRADPAAYAATGAAALALLMVAGYTVVWAWWWLVRR